METSPPKTFLPLFVLVFVAAVHGAVLALRLPLFLSAVPASQWTRMALTLLIFALAQGLALSVWGALSDRFGRHMAILYSLSATIIVAVLGYALLLGIRLPPQFLQAALGGLTTAGLSLALSYLLSMIKEGPRHRAVGFVFFGFFAGTAAMLSCRMGVSAAPLSFEGMITAITTFLLIFTVLAAVLSTYFLPETRSTSVSYSGMNALNGLWHGFTESGRAMFANWWKLFLGFSGFSAGAIALAVLGWDSGQAADSAGVSDSGDFWMLFCFTATAAIAGLVASHVMTESALFGRGSNVASGAALLVSALLLFAPSISGSSAAAALLCGAATGLSCVAGVGYFVAKARKRSGGAEIGAVCAIWVPALVAGAWVALMTCKEHPQILPPVAAGAALAALFTGFMATRRPALS